MPRLQIRDVKEGLDHLTEKCSQTNTELSQKLDQVRNIVYALAAIQFGLVAHMLFSILSQ